MRSPQSTLFFFSTSRNPTPIRYDRAPAAYRIPLLPGTLRVVLWDITPYGRDMEDLSTSMGMGRGYTSLSDGVPH